MATFFSSHLRDDPAAAESKWRRYLRESSALPDSRRVGVLVYECDDSRNEVTFGVT